MASRALPPGLYDELVTVALDQLISGLGDDLRAKRTDVASADASRRLAEHVGRVVSMVVESLGDDDRLDEGAALVHDLLAVLVHHAPDELSQLCLTLPPRLLTAVEPRQLDGSYRS